MYQLKSINIAVLGAGISGLRTAHLIAKESNNTIKKIVIFEKENKIGGVLQNTNKNGFLFEHAAQGVLLSREEFTSVLNELNIQNHVVIQNRKESTRYLLTENNIVPINFNFLNLKKHGLLTFKDIMRILIEFFFRKPKVKNLNETMFKFFSRHFGKKFARTFIVPLSFGIWGGASNKILMRHVFPKLLHKEFGYGSLIRAQLYGSIKNLFYRNKEVKNTKGLASFPEGLSILTSTLFQELQQECNKNKIELVLKLQCHVNIIKKELNNILLDYNDIALQQTNIQEYFNIVLYTGQPWRNLDFNIITQNFIGDRAFEALRKIESHSIAVIGLGGNNSNLNKTAKKGFGALAGNWSQDILGVIFIHSTYPSHVPSNSYLFRVMLGGDREIDIKNKSNDELIDIAKKRLFDSKIIPENTKFDFENIVKWDNYLPLPTEYQDTILESIWKIEALIPGLFISGNYLKGAAIADCLEQSKITAQNIIKYIKSI